MFPALVLAVALLVPAPLSPHFVSAVQWTAGTYTGYEAQMQLRSEPISGVAVWPGTFLTDGLFVQSGLRLPHAYLGIQTDAGAFAWATFRTSGDVTDPSVNLLPFRWDQIDQPTLGAWYTFSLVKTGCVWTLAYVDPGGQRRVQGTFRDCANMRGIQAVTEYWSERTENFGTTAMRGLRVRTPAGRWIVPPDVNWVTDQIGYERVSSATPGNIVFRGADGSATETWARLW